MSGGTTGAAMDLREALVLRVPREDEEEEFLRAYNATSPEVPYFTSYDPGTRFADYLLRIAAQERGENLRPGQVPSTFLFAFAGARIAGRVSIRHRLNEALARRGGHIGYVVVPEFRRNGYATEILRMSLTIARDRLGLRQVLLTCDDDNVASVKTIERNGGVLEGPGHANPGEKPFRRYWIDTSA
jgi:predicted acetyltransferase